VFEFRVFLVLTALCAISFSAFAEDVDADAGGDVTDVALEPDVNPDVSEDVVDADADADALADVVDADEQDVAPDAPDMDSGIETDVMTDVGSAPDILEDATPVQDVSSEADASAGEDGAVDDASGDSELADVQVDAGSDVVEDTISDASPDAGDLPERVTVTGLVRLRQLFEVQREVTVRLGEGSGEPFVTALSGEAFEWVDVPAGSATVVAVAEGFGPATSRVDFSQGSMFEILLYPTAPVALRGRVILPDGSAASGASVSLSGREQVAGQEQATVTDSNGEFGWTSVLPGMYRLSAVSATSSFVSERWEILSGGEVVIVLVDDGSRTPFSETGCTSASAGRAAVGEWWLTSLAVLLFCRRRGARA